MRRTVPALVLGIGLVLLGLPARGPADGSKPAGEGQGKPVKVLARGDWPHLPVHGPGGTPREMRQWALRGKEELEKAAGGHALLTVAHALGVKAIDFDRQMVLAVYDGTQPMVGVSGGGPPSALYRVSVTGASADAEKKVLTVRWRREPRREGDPVLTYPLEAVLVERFDGEVRFQQLPPADKGAGKGPEDAGLKVLARAFWPEGWRAEMPPQQWAVRSYQELIDPRLRAPEPVLERMRKEQAARYAKALGVPALDFDRQMILGVSAGARPAGARVEVTDVTRDAAGKGLTVRWRLVAPGPGAHAPAGLAHPAAVALVEQTPGEVRFVQQPAGR